MIISPATEIEIEPDGVESETMGLPRCIMYKCFFTGKQLIISSSAGRNDDISIIKFLKYFPDTFIILIAHLLKAPIPIILFSITPLSTPPLSPGTNTFPGECTQYYFNGNLTKYLDDASITDKQLNAMRTLARKVDSLLDLPVFLSPLSLLDLFF